MDIRFEVIDINAHFSKCVAFRRDSFFSSFHTYEGFEETIHGYQERMQERINEDSWYYFHVWHESELIGQLEFKSFSTLTGVGYVHLIYLGPEYRGLGLASKLQEFIRTHLLMAGCSKAMLSVSRSNERALRHYKRVGWRYLYPNPKSQEMDFYQLELQ